MLFFPGLRCVNQKIILFLGLLIPLIYVGSSAEFRHDFLLIQKRYCCSWCNNGGMGGGGNTAAAASLRRRGSPPAAAAAYALEGDVVIPAEPRRNVYTLEEDDTRFDLPSEIKSQD